MEQLPAERGIAYMGFSFIVTSIVLVICSSYTIHISLRAHILRRLIDLERDGDVLKRSD